MSWRLASFLLAVATLAAPPAARGDGIMLVAAGAFWMGRDDGAPEEAPLHRVFVTDFWMERTKVTNAEFAAFLNAAGLRPAGAERRYDEDDADARIHLRNGRWTVDAGFEDHPAVEVSWFGARDYCHWTGRRLPTEAEWEKAARGEDRRLYPWGTAPPSPDRAVFGRSYNATAPVDGRPGGASAYGVLDMLGNLREWTATILRPYPYKPSEGWSGVGAVVVRGASHDDSAQELSVTRRRFYERRGASAGHHFVGFRCASDQHGGPDMAPKPPNDRSAPGNPGRSEKDTGR